MLLIPAKRTLRILGVILAASALLFYIFNGRILSWFSNGSTPDRLGVNNTGRRIQISVLNGCSVPGIAMKVTDYLRSLGYDVVEIGNYETSTLTRSMVIDWIDDITAAKKIADAINISPTRIIRKKNNRELVDFSVVLGKDYRQLNPLRQSGLAPRLVRLQSDSPGRSGDLSQ